MPVFQISYDLNKPGQNYDRLLKAIKASYNWKHVLKSTWLVWTSETAGQLQNRLLKAIDANDRLLLSEVTSANGGWMPSAVWDWLNTRLSLEADAKSRAAKARHA